MTEEDKINFFLDGTFSAEEIEVFNNITEDFVNIKHLEKTGVVEITRTVSEDDIVNEIITYTSYDDKCAFVRNLEYPLEKEAEMLKQRYLAGIDLVVRQEDYEQAGELKTKLEQLNNVTPSTENELG